MHENKFEKDVQQKLDELSFSPSPEIWQKVEEEIRKKRDRRRLVFWLLPLALLAGGAGFWLVKNQRSGDRKVYVTPSYHSITVKSNSIKLPLQKNKTIEKAIDNGVKINNEEWVITDKQRDSVATVWHEPAYSIATTIKISVNNKRLRSNAVIAKKSAVEKSIIQEKEVKTISKATSSQPINNLHESKAAIDSAASMPNVANADQHEKVIDSIANDKANKEVEPVRPVIEKKKKENKKWKWSLVTNVGVASNAKGLGPIEKNYIYASPSTSSNPGTRTSSASKIERGISFSVGGGLQKDLSKRTSFYTGLQYSFYQTKIKIGIAIRRDTTIMASFSSSVQLSSYYTNDRQTTNYHNQFHLVEIPVGISYRMLKKIPVRWEGGLVVNRLLSTNALLFNQRSNIYFKDKDAYSKTGLQVATGFSYTASLHLKRAITIGPALRYNLSALTKENTNQQHLLFVGIQSRIGF